MSQPLFVSFSFSQGVRDWLEFILFPIFKLARALFFGKRGELREKGIHQQLQRASALNILINAVGVWKTVYLSEAIKVQKMNGTFQEDLIPHVSPLAWEHIKLKHKERVKRVTYLI